MSYILLWIVFLQTTNIFSAPGSLFLVPESLFLAPEQLIQFLLISCIYRINNYAYKRKFGRNLFYAYCLSNTSKSLFRFSRSFANSYAEQYSLKRQYVDITRHLNSLFSEYSPYPLHHSRLAFATRWNCGRILIKVFHKAWKHLYKHRVGFYPPWWRVFVCITSP